MADSGQVAGFAQFKDGKLDGSSMTWYEIGQKASEETFKDGEEAQTYPESKKQPHPVPISLREVGGSVSNQSFCHACK